jgi:putative membrane protein
MAALTVACNGDRRATRADNDTAAVGTSGNTAAPDVSRGDRNFVADLMNANNAEVELGKLASERAAASDVKQFGQMMIQDHTKAGDELKQIAMLHNIEMPGAALDDKHRDLMDKLSKLQGREFDREYMKAMVDGHEDVIDKLQSRVDEVNRGRVATGKEERDVNVKPEASNDPITASLNEWAANALPVVKGHRDRAKAINDRLDGSQRNTTARK